MVPVGDLQDLVAVSAQQAVMGDAVGMNALGDLGEQRCFLQRPPCPGHSRLGVDDDIVDVDLPGVDQR